MQTLFNRIAVVAATLALALCVVPARADTLNMPIFLPNTFVQQVDQKYTIVNTVAGVLGKFTATGTAVSVTGGGSPPLPGTMTLVAYFDRTTGLIIKDHPTENTLDPLLDVRDASNNVMYFSRHINRFAYDLSVSLPTFDFEFFNEGGSMPAINPLAFIGATLRNAATFTGTKSFISAAAVGTVVFDNNKVAGLEVGTANVFMTPTPTAIAGGIGLLGGLFVVTKLKLRRQSAIAD